MGRSSPSCFKVMVCGSDGAGETDDLERTESKSSTDKRGWSFRKRSARHRVLSNTVISEPTTVGNKEESPTIATNDFHVQSPPMIPEKISQRVEEKLPPLISHAARKASDVDSSLQESIVIVIQTAVRGYLAQRTLCKLKNVVKLQAAVRGHLVRRQAVGTLRCVQAIVKMQALVRARRVRMSMEGSAIWDKLDAIEKTDNQQVRLLFHGKENSGTEANKGCYSTKKILASRFARQLLASTPKSKPINIKCDPSRPDLAWKWLERWMSVSSSEALDPQKMQLNKDNEEQGENKKLHASEVRTVVHTEVVSDSADVKSDIKQIEISLESEEDYNADDFEFQASKPKPVLEKTSGSGMKEDMMQCQVEDEGLGTKQESSTKTRKALKETSDSLSNQIVMESNVTSQAAVPSVADKLEADNGNPKRPLKRVASEQLEAEGKKLTFVARKSSNPAFAAVQSKFEELSSTATSGRLIGSGFHDAVVESRLDFPPYQADSATKKMDITTTEDSVRNDPRIQTGGSECGTELSISSTLDSPDRSEAEGGEFVHVPGDLDKVNCDPNDAKNGIPRKLDAEANNLDELETLQHSSNAGFIQRTESEEVDQGIIDSAAAVDITQAQEQPSENITSDMHVQLETVKEQPADNLSLEGSPRSHITAPESHGTPSSQVSVSAKRNKSDTTSALKRRSQTVAKRSPSKQNSESSVRSSTEHLPKEPKNGKRRNSLDHEPRVSNSNSLPNYMQATESARAKAHANNSPRSSPDVQDKDVYIKKRHSLPATNGKEDSPRMQRSMSQAQQNAKRNGTHSPHNAAERKWQR